MAIESHGFIYRTSDLYCSHTQMNSRPIKKLFDNLKSFSKNLCFVGSSTLCSKIEGILTADYRRLKTYNSYSNKERYFRIKDNTFIGNFNIFWFFLRGYFSKISKFYLKSYTLSKSLPNSIFLQWKLYNYQNLIMDKNIQITAKVRLITCSWHQKNETTNSPIHESKADSAKRPDSLLNSFLMVYYFLFLTLKIW